MSNDVYTVADIHRTHPWRELGEEVTPNIGMEEALKMSGSDDTVVPATLYTLEESKPFLYHSDGHTYVRLDQLEEVDDFMSVKSNKYGTMGVHSPGFAIKQRSEILEMAYDFTGLDPEGSHIETIGNFGSKKQVFFAYVRVPDLVIDPNGIADTIERGLYVATSFNGSIPNIMGYSNLRVACFNALQMAFKTGQQVIKAKHTLNADDRLRAAAEAMEYIGAVEAATIANAEAMLSVDGGKAMDTINEHFFPLPKDLSDAGRTRRLRERGEVRMLYSGTGNTATSLVGDNGWAAYQAFTDWIDHQAGVKVGKDKTRAAMVRAERAVMPGPMVDKKIKASRLVLELADA